MINSVVTNPIDALQRRYLRALDNRRIEDWVACFSPEESSYVCTTFESRQANFEIAMMRDTSFARIKDRAKMITEVWQKSFEDYATRHLIQSIDVEQRSDGLFAATSNFLVMYVSPRRQSEVLGSGVYEDLIVVGEDGVATFRSRTALLDGPTAPRYLVYPV